MTICIQYSDFAADARIWSFDAAGGFTGITLQLLENNNGPRPNAVLGQSELFLVWYQNLLLLKMVEFPYVHWLNYILNMGINTPLFGVKALLCDPKKSPWGSQISIYIYIIYIYNIYIYYVKPDGQNAYSSPPKDQSWSNPTKTVRTLTSFYRIVGS